METVRAEILRNMQVVCVTEAKWTETRVTGNEVVVGGVQVV